MISERNTGVTPRRAPSLRCATGEMGRVIGAAGALVTRHLRVGAQRTRAVDGTLANARGNDLARRLTGSDPLVERTDPIEGIGTIATAAVAHAGNHEQSD